MSGHASSFDLDEAAAGLASGAVRSHLAACAKCSAKLEQLSAGRKEIAASEGYRQTLARLPQERARRSRSWVLFPALGALAAAALLVVVVRPAEGLRAKGSASIELLDSTGRPDSTPRVGSEARLALSGGSHRYALVLALEGSNSAVALWPAGASQSGELPGGRASAQLRVTPGAVHLVAAFSDAPLSLEQVANKQVPGDVEFRELEIQPTP